jgi:antitoxin PrlF
VGIRATMTTKGQVTVPKEVRERHNLKPGDTIEFIEENGRTWVRARNVRAVDLAGILGPPPSGEILTAEQMDEAVMDAVAEDDERTVREWHEGRE